MSPAIYSHSKTDTVSPYRVSIQYIIDTRVIHARVSNEGLVQFNSMIDTRGALAMSTTHVSFTCDTGGP